MSDLRLFGFVVVVFAAIILGGLVVFKVLNDVASIIEQNVIFYNILFGGIIIFFTYRSKKNKSE